MSLLRRFRLRFLVGTAFVALAVYAAAAGASTSRARLAPITGSLSQSGYTVIALGYSGKVTTAKGGKFSITPPASPVTLQLVNAHGKYAGPVVVGGGGSRIYEGVRAGAKLGRINVKNGYAVVTRRLASRLIDKSRWAHAVHGVPVANGRNYGLVRIAGKHAGSSAPGGDLAHSGVPNDISIDPQANMQIAALAPASKPVKAKAAGDGGGPACDPSICVNGATFDLFAGLTEDVTDTANVDAGSTIENIDAGVSRDLLLHIDSPFDYDVGNIAAAFAPGTSLAELDCAGLSWCSPGGSGHLAPTDDSSAPGPAFPDCCDPTGDGFGTIFGPGAPTFTAGGVVELWPGAPSEQIGTGDTPILNLTVNGVVVQQPDTLAYVFDTVPAIDTWSDGAGHSGTLTYPAVAPENTCVGASPGTACDPLPVAANSSGNVMLTLTWWRPQREGISGAGEPAFMDIGHLAYSLNFNFNMPNNFKPPISCPATTITTSDPELIVTEAPLSTSGANDALIDSAGDRPANPANTLTATVNLTQCFADAGEAFPMDTLINFQITASPQQSASEGNAATDLQIERVG